SELKVDESISHDGVCLTVVKVENNRHVVTAVEETLWRSSLNYKKEGDEINLERSMLLNGRLDGHIVQGHVDGMMACDKISEKNGSWIFRFHIKDAGRNLIVEKGSICINGVSLTVAKLSEKKFSVAIIPFTFEHTTFKNLKPGDEVNIEYDIIGKYVSRMMKGR
ncbi:MAG: riboflavin synthase, partial [Chitinophagales bacterium]